MHNVASFCDRVIYINQGQIRQIGDPGEAISAYTADMMDRRTNDKLEDGSDMSKVLGSGKMVITNIEFINQQGEAVKKINLGEPITVRVSYRTNEPVKKSFDGLSDA